MISYIVRRLLLMLLVILGLSVITFILSRVVPSDPAAAYIGPHARPEQVAQVRVKLGLDRPIWVQYAYYMRDILHGDFGQSIRTHQPVIREISRKLPASLELILAAIFSAIIIGIPLGVLSACWENRAFDHLSRSVAVAGVSIPGFWLGLLFQILFYRNLRLLPLGGRIDIATSLLHPIKELSGFYVLDSLITGNWVALKAALLHLVLPALTLAAYPIGLITRMTRSTMLEVLQEDYIRTARAAGFSEWRVMFIHALRNAIGPTLTAIGLTFAFMLTGTFFIELIFYWPGLGTYTTQAILLNDYPVIMGITLLMSIFYVVINLVVDLLLAFSDPRIRLE
jgi:peptide/nickel transport system permease protein